MTPDLMAAGAKTRELHDLRAKGLPEHQVILRYPVRIALNPVSLANAGIASFAPVDEMTDEMWDDMIDVNLSGVWKSVKAAIPHIILMHFAG